MAARRNTFMTTVDGGEELAAVFDELPKSLTDAVLRATAKKALAPVAATAASMVRRDDGDVADSITVSTTLSKRQKKLFRRRGEIAVYAGPSPPQGAAGHLIEFGTGPRYHKSGKFVGIMPASPFMRPAWDAHSGQVLQTMRDEIWGVLKKAVARLRKRAEKGKLSKSQQKFFAGG